MHNWHLPSRTPSPGLVQHRPEEIRSGFVEIGKTATRQDPYHNGRDDILGVGRPHQDGSETHQIVLARTPDFCIGHTHTTRDNR
jgi:hypothetical protein